MSDQGYHQHHHHHHPHHPQPHDRNDDDYPKWDNDRMSRGWIIASFLFGGFALIVVAFIATHFQNRQEPPPPPRISIVTTETDVRNPFSIRFLTDQPVRNGPVGIVWGPYILHPHLMVDSMMFMPGTSSPGSNRYGTRNDVVVSKRDTFLILVPHLSRGLHTIRLFWANPYHLDVGDTAIIQVHVIK